MKNRVFAKPAWMLAAGLLMAPAMARAGEAEGGGEGDLTRLMMRLVIQVGVILFAARLGNILFERLKLPGVLGELCIGIVIGPFLLGGIGIPFLSGFEHGLFGGAGAGQVPVSTELYGFCTVASVVLLFLVGVETDLKMFTRYSLAGSLVGVGGVICSFVGGHQFAYWFMRTAEQRAAAGFFDPGCVFLGVMSTATSVSITARILSEKRKMDTPEGVTILAGAVIDDVLGVIMLAIGIGVIGGAGAGAADGARTGVNWLAIGSIALKSVLIWLGATVAGVLLSRWIAGGLKRFAGARTQIGVMALGLALVVSGLFEEAHLAMIIGAYVMGLSLSRADIARVVQESLHPVFAFLVPVFFVVMGMMVDVRQLADRGVIVAGLLYTLVAVAAKLVGCGLPTLLCGFTPRGALRVGLGMVPRGEVALIVAGVGLASGFLRSSDFGIAVFMTLVTTLVPPPLLVKAFSSPKPGHRSKRDEAAPEIFYDFPAPEAAALVLRQFLDVMRREGFFVHRLDHGDRIYQLRKDAMVIGVDGGGGARIAFDCDAVVFPFLHTAMREVIAEVDGILAALRRPFTGRDVTTTLTGGETAPVDGRLLRHIRRETLVPRLKGTTRDAVIAELVDALAGAGLVADPGEALAAVLRREASMTTAIGNGMAIPHARTRQAAQLACAIGVSPGGVDFGADDGAPVRIVVLVLCPEEAIAPYMAFMAGLRGALDAEARDALPRAGSADAMLAVLLKNRG